MMRRRDPGTEGRLERLLDAALAEFASRSFEDASLNAILKAAGISKGVFYHHFTDKLALYQALLQQLADMKVKVISEHTGDGVMPKPGEDLFDYFQRMLALNALIAAHDPLLYRFGLRFAREPAEFRLRATGSIEGAADVTGALVAHGLAAGTFDPRYPPEFVKAVFTYFIEHVFDLMPLTEDNPEEIAAQMELLFRFLRHGLGR